MPEQTKKRHHQIPVFYLQRFTSPHTGQIWNYDKQTLKAWACSVDDTAVERHLYSFTMDDGQHNTEIEDLISKIEETAAPLFQQVSAGKELGGQERYDFASFLALMFVRTNAYRRLFAELHGNMKMLRDYLVASNDSLFESRMERFQADRGKISEKEKQTLRATMLDPSNYTFLVDREYTLKALRGHDELAPLLSSMKWTVMDAPKEWNFITSDNPVVQWVHPKHRHPFYGTGGLRNKHVQVQFPLSPAQCWLGHWSDKAVSRFETTPQDIKRTNRITAEASERFLYSHFESAGIMKLAKKYADSQPKMKMGGPGPEKKAEIRVVRSLRENRK
jgi:hypothetical protein